MAVARVKKIINALSEELNLSKENVIKEGVRTFLEKNLREVKAEIFRLTGKYGIRSVEEMEERYKEGTLEEKNSWPDFQHLDHLEYKKERLERLLEELR